ncbi:hypothetical protein OQE61_00150 [Cetobacterium somerae]|uniref:hypothetical protein n=1 Tax=Cetobacterium somerae TaxID=188913 RepID=UPI0022595D1B|nr:hypothetical protein [Cetobacterium somerae]MCX3065903.1 hypothetical protein [Cetobacterium somerae]
MHSTMINILKILHQTKITKENLAHNLDIKEGTLLKSINAINTFLRDLKLEEIRIEKGIVKLEIKKTEWCEIFEKINTLTFEEKVDYLYIKLVYYGFINLEKEREYLDISRSSINRCFLIIKKLLETNGSKITYNNGKGTELIELTNDSIIVFALKTTKLILEEDILTPVQKKLLNNIKKFNIKTRSTKLVAIYKCLKLLLTPTLLCFLCALDIKSKYFQTENYSFEKYNDIQMLERIRCVVNSVGNIGFSEDYKNILVQYIYMISSNEHYFLKDIFIRAKKISEDLFKILKITDMSLKPNLIQQLYFSILRKDYGILKIRNVDLLSEDFLLLDIIDKVLKDNSQKLNICDKYFIISILKENIIENYLLNIKKVLILVGEINTLGQKKLKKDLEENFPKIEFNIDYNYLNIEKFIFQLHDVVIDDFQSTLRDGTVFYRIKRSLEEKILKNVIEVL